MGKKSREAWPMPFIGPTSGSSGNRSAPYCSISFFLKQFWLFRTQKSHCPAAPPSRSKSDVCCRLYWHLIYVHFCVPLSRANCFIFNRFFPLYSPIYIGPRCHLGYTIRWIVDFEDFCNFLKIKLNGNLT